MWENGGSGRRRSLAAGRASASERLVWQLSRNGSGSGS